MKSLQLPPTQAQKGLQKTYGHQGVEAVYGAGCLQNPRMMLVFMNPTARNTSSQPSWQGLRAPWIGVKKTWNMFADLGLVAPESLIPIENLKPEEWEPHHAETLYTHAAERGLYVTNLATCTQPDARPLPDSLFKEYLPHFLNEIYTLKPAHIVTFGNQVSSVCLGKSVSVSHYEGTQHEILHIAGEAFPVYPTWYPVGQGQRNMPKAIERIRHILAPQPPNPLIP